MILTAVPQLSFTNLINNSYLSGFLVLYGNYGTIRLCYSCFTYITNRSLLYFGTTCRTEISPAATTKPKCWSYAHPLHSIPQAFALHGIAATFSKSHVAEFFRNLTLAISASLRIRLRQSLLNCYSKTYNFQNDCYNRDMLLRLLRQLHFWW